MKAIDVALKKLDESVATTVVYLDYEIGTPYFRDVEAVVRAINLARVTGSVTLLISKCDADKDAAESVPNSVKEIFGLVANREREFDFKMRDSKEERPYWRVIDVTVNHPAPRKRAASNS